MSSSQIQTLSNEFNSLLTEYQTTYSEFMNTLKSNDTSLTTVENSAFTGSGTINTSLVSSISDCTTACSSNTSCTGATFTTNSNNNNCTLSSGSGNIVNATNSTAIVQTGLSYSYQLQNLNQQLMDINQQINTIVNQSNTTYQNNLGQINEQGQALQQNYVVLTGDRDRIDLMIREFETLNEAQQNSDINVTMNYYNYIVLLFVAIFLVVLLLRFSVPSEQVGGGRNSVGNIFKNLFSK